ncbi:TPA: hypothetical protein ACVGIZ_001724 [Pseudomonas aeruginosa]
MITSLLKLTAAHTPNDYQECLVYSPCEGFMIATWKNFEDDQGFYLFGTYEPLEPEQAVFWMPLPSVEAMSAYCDSQSTRVIAT